MILMGFMLVIVDYYIDGRLCFIVLIKREIYNNCLEGKDANTLVLSC